MAAKAVTYAATFGAAGALFFLSYAGRLLADDDHGAIRRLALKLMVASILASGFRIEVTAASMSGELSGLIDLDLVRMVWQSGEWRAALARAAGFLPAAAALATHRKLRTASLLGAAVAASSFVWVGHVHAFKSGWLAVDAGIHLLGVAFWIGALAPLLVVLKHDDARAAAGVVARFGAAAIFGVGALILAGVVLLCALLGGWPELWRSDYGRWILLKLAMVAGLLSLAALNKWRFTPRLLANDATALAGLRRSIRIELMAAALVLTVTAAFTTLTGPPALN